MENQEQQIAEADAPRRPIPGTGLFEILTYIVGALLLFVVVTTFVGKIIEVDGSSMYPTLEDKEKMVVSNLFFEPQQGDIVIFTKKSFSDNPLVKRVIATEGQTVDISLESGQVSVNGEILNETYINEITSVLSDVEFPVTVPEGCIFVMGDNRNASTDSRASVIGMVDARCIIGKVYWIIYPFNKIGAVD